jgi:hypothetical protein
MPDFESPYVLSEEFKQDRKLKAFAWEATEGARAGILSRLAPLLFGEHPQSRASNIDSKDSRVGSLWLTCRNAAVFRDQHEGVLPDDLTLEEIDAVQAFDDLKAAYVDALLENATTSRDFGGKQERAEESYVVRYAPHQLLHHILDHWDELNLTASEAIG